RLVRRPWWCGLFGALLLLALVRPAPLTRVVTGWPPPGWRYAMCDVGQGDATVLAAGAGAGVVVDAGPDPAAVDRCLRQLGITRVPLLVLTHFHADHVAGLPGVLRGREVAAIETTGFEEPRQEAEFVRREAAGRHIPVTRAVAGEERRTGPLSWRVLWPPADTGPPTAAG
ncbi:MBL fold metallo-hydrolase, partial [Streptomyces sp. SID6139]|nr:MBL fold metallo-hydrolase [Streptomyces sp. SID6139]